MSLTQLLKPSDLLIIRTGGLAAHLIQIGQSMMGQPNLGNHVALAHHLDQSGKFWWLLEGRPGGVGWADSRKYEHSRYMLNNCGQPRTEGQRQAITIEAEHLIGTAYDWAAIADDTLRAFHMPELWKRVSAAPGVAPAQVVCSSYAAFLYDHAGCDVPQWTAEDTTPGDWDGFILDRGYHRAP